MLGYTKGYSVAMISSNFGHLEYPNFAMNYVACKGSESSIYNCGKQTTTSCGRYSAAGVTCDYIPKGIIQLVGGKTSNQGNVLIDGKPVW